MITGLAVLSVVLIVIGGFAATGNSGNSNSDDEFWKENGDNWLGP